MTENIPLNPETPSIAQLLKRAQFEKCLTQEQKSLIESIPRSFPQITVESKQEEIDTLKKKFEMLETGLGVALPEKGQYPLGMPFTPEEWQGEIDRISEHFCSMNNAPKPTSIPGKSHRHR